MKDSLSSNSLIFPHSSLRSFVLISTLLIISLLTGVIVTSLQYGLQKAKIVAAFNQNIKTELLSRTALDRTEGLFLESIRKNSSNSTGPFYYPQNRQSISPPRLSEFGATSKILMLSGTNNNINQETTLPSKNGKVVSLKSWNRAKIEPLSHPPSWIYLTDDRRSAHKTQKNLSGRFAFVAYDLSGLIDINQLAGTPSMEDAAKGLYPSLDQSDLKEIPGSLDSTRKTVAQWLLPILGTDPSVVSDRRLDAEEEWVDSKIRGREKNMISDKANLFLSRSDFLNANRDLFSLPEESLYYFSVGNLDLNTSIYDPNSMSSPIKNPTINAKFDRYLVTAPFLRRNGKPALVGEPIVYDRFPLSRIKNITDQGPARGTSPSVIQRDFGLIWNESKKDWVYVGNSGTVAVSTIKTIDQVAKENREPNFFELLKMSILDGSLAQNWGQMISDLSQIDSSKDIQIIRIGSNIIDQCDNDSYPTSVQFGGHYFCGIENLPYFNNLNGALSNPTGAFSSIEANYTLAQFYELWNPHQNNPYKNINDRPSSISLIANRHQGTSGLVGFVLDAVNGVASGLNGIAGNSDTQPFFFNGDLTDPNTRIDIPNTAFSIYNNPAGVKSYSTKVPVSPNLFVSSIYKNNNYNGESIVLNKYIRSDNSQIYFFGKWWDNPILINSPSSFRIKYTNAFFSIAYETKDNQRKVYTTFTGSTNLISSGITSGANFKNSAATGNLDPFIQPTFDGALERDHFIYKTDPRTDRLGISICESYESIGMTNYTVRPRAGGIQSQTGISVPIYYYNIPKTINYKENNVAVGSIAENRYSNHKNYSDPDGIVRWGDCGLNPDPTTSTLLVNPMDLNTTTNRPIVLDRPALSRGELGYVFRDMPWKSLDLFTTNSADAGLLETFCAKEKGRVIGGTINLNSAPKEVIAALLSGKRRSEFNENDLISSSEAQKIADDFIEKREALGGLHNLSELVTQISDTTVNNEKPASKMRREAVIRALSEVGTTRTWNLFFDIVLQSGTSSNDSEHPSSFRVDVTKRYWIHLTVDRLTGKVLQRNIEPLEG